MGASGVEQSDDDLAKAIAASMEGVQSVQNDFVDADSELARVLEMSKNI